MEAGTNAAQNSASRTRPQLGKELVEAGEAKFNAGILAAEFSCAVSAVFRRVGFPLAAPQAAAATGRSSAQQVASHQLAATAVTDTTPGQAAVTAALCLFSDSQHSETAAG
jgi:hypothetical protein